MCRVLSPLLIAGFAVLGFAGGVRANTVECGGNSISFAEVAPSHRGKLPRGKPRKGPIEVMPDSLCADLIEDRPQAIESLQVTIDPRAQQPQRASPRPE
jgi:hypothetical protein